MSNRTKSFFAKATLIAVASLLFLPLGAPAQTTAPASATPASSEKTTTSPSKDRWLHVRVISSDAKGETVRVNVPLELAEAVLPSINHNRMHDGKVNIDCAHMNDVDLKALAAAVHNAKDGEYVTVQGRENDVRVAKQNNYLIVHVLDKSERKSKGSQVEIKVPMKVVDALFSAGKDELDLVAALHVLSGQGDMELVSVKDSENTVRVWLDSKNVTE
jgi:hypothetical protein